jgi:hypothetical protein
LEKNENGDLLADFDIMNRWKNFFSQVHSVGDVGQMEVHTATLFVLITEPSPFKVEPATRKLKSYNH